MNILYCGNNKVEDGLLLSVLSLIRNINEPIHIYILTMEITTTDNAYQPISGRFAAYLDGVIKKANPEHTVLMMDITGLFQDELPAANLGSRFTPYCMLRLFADKIPDMPDKILYLDIDVICRKDFTKFYYQDISAYEFAGVLDYYGRWFFRRDLFHLDYMNSGVLLLNLKRIRETGLFQRCRQLCMNKKMFMPDQSAINKIAAARKTLPRCYNEQRRMQENTVFQHFTTTFRIFPWLHTLTVKPWQIDKVHRKLKLHEYDDLFSEYTKLLPEIKN